MEKLTTYIKGDKIVIQRADYIEDGWYVEIDKDVITLYEIPLGGGVESSVGFYDTVLEAIDAGKELT